MPKSSTAIVTPCPRSAVRIGRARARSDISELLGDLQLQRRRRQAPLRRASPRPPSGRSVSTQRAAPSRFTATGEVERPAPRQFAAWSSAISQDPSGHRTHQARPPRPGPGRRRAGADRGSGAASAPGPRRRGPAPVVEVHLGLVVHDELVRVEGGAELLGERAAARRRRVVAAVHDVPAHRLRAVHRHVGLAQQGRQVRAVLGVQRDPGARRRRAPRARRGGTVPSRAPDAAGHRGRFGRARALQEDRELVPAQPYQHVVRAQAVPQALGDLDQQLVTGVVPERVVDLLEPVQVEQQQGLALRGLAPAGSARRAAGPAGWAGRSGRR